MIEDSEFYTFAPASEKQAMFLSSDADIIIYGGAMGGGKSYCGLLRHLRWVDDPHYRGYVVRKQQTSIMKSGGLFDEAFGLYKAFDPRVKVNRKAMTFTFPSGAVIAMGHCETNEDAEKWRGLQLSAAMIDEAVQLQEDHVLVLLSRLRSKAKMKPNLFLTCNPNPDSFIRKWIDWWILPKEHPQAGRVDPDRDGKIRWFIRLNNEMIWGDSKEELVKRYGAHVLPLSLQMISANIFDNPPLIKANPGYLANLQGLKRVKQERDLWGNWDIREETSGYFKREWVEPELLDYPLQSEIEKIVRAYDLAGTLKSETNTDPDYTASVKMAKLKDGSFVILEVNRLRARYGDLMRHILTTAHRDGTSVDIIIPQEPGQAGKAAAMMMIREIAANGFYAKARPTNKSKLERFRPFAAAAESGSIKVLKGCATCLEHKIDNDNEFFYAELEAFSNTRNQKDDMVDACGDAFMSLAQKLVLPNFLSGMQNFGFEKTTNPLVNIR